MFVSAAEAGWTFQAPVPFLEKYLTAKRAVENKLLAFIPNNGQNNILGKSSYSLVVVVSSVYVYCVGKGLRPVIMRPSLVWTTEKPEALVSVVPFYIG